MTVLMRVVFLLFAEERGLLPQGHLFATGYGLAGLLDELDERARHEGEEALDATHLTWHRLLATSQALYEGATFEDLRLPAYGGSLFDPGRFPFLTAVTARGTLALQVSDRVLLHVLRAVQVARPRGQDARRISFRDIDVEQIGYIYEGLLGYTCRVADEVVVGLLGSDGDGAGDPAGHPRGDGRAPPPGRGARRRDPRLVQGRAAGEQAADCRRRWPRRCGPGTRWRTPNAPCSG